MATFHVDLTKIVGEDYFPTYILVLTVYHDVIAVSQLRTMNGKNARIVSLTLGSKLRCTIFRFIGLLL